MKKIKKVTYDNGSEAFIDGNITISMSGAKSSSVEEIELEDEDAKKILETPVFYKLTEGKVELKDREDIPEKHLDKFDEIKASPDLISEKTIKS
jgi:hypothetical protein